MTNFKVVNLFVLAYVVITINAKNYMGTTPVTSATKYPFMAFLTLKNLAIPDCSATILSERYVVTLAYCLFYMSPKKNLTSSDLQIGYGSNSYKSAQFASVESIFVHPNYKPDYKIELTDIVLIKVDRDFEFGPNVNKIDLEERFDQHTSGVNLTALEWITPCKEVRCLPYPSHPVDWKAEERSTLIQELRVQYLDYKKCQSYAKLYTPTMPQIFLNFCVFSDQVPCHGNIGGPFFDTKNGRYILRGIVFEKIYCTHDVPTGVILSIDNFKRWARYTMDSN